MPKEKKEGHKRKRKELEEVEVDENVEAEGNRAGGGSMVSITEYSDMVVAILIPVCITMLIVVILVRALYVSDDGDANSLQSISFAMFVYSENESDSAGLKLGGALLNAFLFLVVILIVTCVLVVLYKFHCMKCIIGWLIVSVIILLLSMGGYFFYTIIDTLNAPLDIISMLLILWNFAVVGAVCVFWAAPQILNKAYLIMISVLVAGYFTMLPEWTTWAILIIIALYDLFTVLCPKGPLKVLVETAQERNEPIPALLYNGSVTFMGATKDQSDDNSNDNDDNDEEENEGKEAKIKKEKKEKEEKEERKSKSDISDSDSGEEYEEEIIPGDVKIEEKKHHKGKDNDKDNNNTDDDEKGEKEKKKKHKKKSDKKNDHKKSKQKSKQNQKDNDDSDDDDDEDEYEYVESGKRTGVKLGLGDFVFYSVLVGRAALYDMLTVFTSFISIITGLFGTLILLALFEKPLPALPVSIALGTIFYFLSRLFLVPFATSNALQEIFV